MQIGDNTVVSLRYELFNADGGLIEKTDTPIEYLHGHCRDIPRVEQVLLGKSAGASCEVVLQPADAFGDYDEKLLAVEPRDKFPDKLEVGMRFEGEASESGATVMYTVTDIAEGKVVVDGNHPLAGQKLHFHCTVDAVRRATKEELSHGHAHGAHGHHH